MIRLLADIAGTLGMLLFLIAEMRQLCKIRQTGKLTGISYHAYLSKFIAVMLTGICFVLTGLHFSLIVIVGEGIVIAPILYWLWKKRNKKTLNTVKQSRQKSDKEWRVPISKVTTSEETLKDLWDNKFDERWNKI